MGDCGRSCRTLCCISGDLSGCGEGGKFAGKTRPFLPGPPFHGEGKWEPETTHNALS